jgi:WD40 repeat protein
VTKDGNNARKRAARDLAAAEQISYTEALHRLAAPAAGEISVSVGTAAAPRARVVRPAPTLTARSTLVGHTGGVTSLAFHPDGRTLASGGDVTARLWDLDTAQNTAVLEGREHVSCVAFDPGGGVLAVGHVSFPATGEVSVWTIATGEVVTLSGFSGGVRSVAFSPDGHTLAVVAQGNDEQIGRYVRVVHLWDVRTRRATVLATRSGSYGAAAAFHPGGDVLVGSGGLDGSVDLWNLATGEATVLTGHASGVETVAFDPTGAVLATGSVDETVRLWDVATGRTTAVLEPRSGYVMSVALSPDGRTLATSSADQRLWDVGSGEVVAVLHGHTDLVPAVAFSPDGRTLATASADRIVRLWDLP